MSENMRNVVVIDITDFNTLQCDNINLRDEVRDLKKKIKIFEDYFINNILASCKYELKNIENYSVEDYYVRIIICNFLEYGSFDYQYMINKIKDYKESKKESDENESKKQ